MSLATDLAKIRAGFEKRASPSIAKLVIGALDEAAAEFAKGDHIKSGDTAPDFTLPGVDGRQVKLSEEIKTGPVVLTFYRGSWCPYCNLELRAYQALLPDIKAKGASLIAISPQLPDHSLSTAQKNALTFPVLSDVGSKTASDYGLVFELPDAMKPLYEAQNHATPDFNGPDDWRLPVPATFVIGSDGRVRLAFVDFEYSTRLEPAEALAALDR